MSSYLASEYEEQVTLIQWLDLKGLPYFHVPNSTYTQSFNQKRRNKALGVVPGVPDVFVVLPYVGIVALELKRRKRGVVSPAQKQWIETLNTVDNVQAYVACGSDEAIAIVERLLGKSLGVSGVALPTTEDHLNF